MKRLVKLLSIIIFVSLPISLLAQNAIVTLDYMKVNPGQWWNYLELEKEWKTKVHKKMIEAEMITGWQLWQKMYAAGEDEYHRIKPGKRI